VCSSVNSMFCFTAEFDLDDDFLNDPRYTEVFKEAYLRPIDGHRVFAIQPGDCFYGMW